MKIGVCFICLLILFAFSGYTGLTQNPRDLTRYDDGGAFDFNWGAGPEAHAQMMPKLRRFLWEHWTQKHLAHLVVTLYSIEGDPTTYNLFIEPDKDQRWRVVAEYEMYNTSNSVRILLKWSAQANREFSDSSGCVKDSRP